MASSIEWIYAALLDRQYPRELFGSLPGFAKKGSGYIACCPFHEDTLPTLVIYADRPEYFCFACSSRGDWLKYLQEIRGMSFSGALSFLSAQAGIDAGEYDETSWQKDLDRSMLLEAAAGFFITRLFAAPGNETLRYLYQRGYAMGEVEGSCFGFYPGLGQLKGYLSVQGMDRGFIDEELAAIWSKDAENFHLTIPYRDLCGRLMGVVGRDITKTGPDAYRGLTDLSMLKDTPFLMYKARRQEELIMVGGLFDALLVDQIGIRKAVAIGRSGLSRGQIDTVAACGVKRCILCLGNGPGRERQISEAKELIGSRGLEAAVLPLPDAYEDLDQFIRLTDLHEFKKLLKKAERSDRR